MKFIHNWSIMWGLGRYEVRIWRHWPFKIQFFDYGKRYIPNG